MIQKGHQKPQIYNKKIKYWNNQRLVKKSYKIEHQNRFKSAYISSAAINKSNKSRAGTEGRIQMAEKLLFQLVK